MVVAVLRRFIRHTAGASAVELALIAPFVLGLLLVMADVGFAIHQRMAMNYILRLGGGAAMLGANEDRLIETLNLAVDDHATARMADLQVADPAWVCRCPSANDAVIDCAQPCPNGEPPDVYVALAAELPYRSILTGDALDITLRSSLQVQVRARP